MQRSEKYRYTNLPRSSEKVKANFNAGNQSAVDTVQKIKPFYLEQDDQFRNKYVQENVRNLKLKDIDAEIQR